MRASTAFQECATLLDELEATGLEVRAITPHEDDLLEEDSVTVDLSLGVPLLDEIETDGIEITSQSGDALTDGTLTVDLTVQVPLDHDSTDQPADSQPEIDLPESEKEIISDGSGTPPQTATKPYRDPDRLREVYDTHETFAEMTDALDVDVTTETVRTNMIKHGIHEPASHSSESTADPTAADRNESTNENESTGDEDVNDNAGAESELPDEIELPEGMTLEQLKTTVQSARSFLDVQRELGGDRDTTYQLLKDLNLLDLVHGRLSKQAERTISTEQIDERIRQSVSHHSQPTARSD